jgi:hypothetical protein
MILLELFAVWRRVHDAQPVSETNSSRALSKSWAQEEQLHTSNPPFTPIRLFKKVAADVGGDP